MTRQEFLEKFKACELHIVCANTTERAEALRFLSEELGLTLSTLGEAIKSRHRASCPTRLSLYYSARYDSVCVTNEPCPGRPVAAPAPSAGMVFLFTEDAAEGVEEISEEDFAECLSELLGGKRKEGKG